MAMLTIWRNKVSNDNTAVKAAFSTEWGKIRADESSSEANYDEYDDEHGESYDSLGDSSHSATKADKKSIQRKKKATAAKQYEKDKQEFEEKQRKFESDTESLTAILSQQVEIDRMNAETSRMNAESQSQMMQLMFQQLKGKKKRSRRESEDEVWCGVGCLSRCSNIRVVELLEINYIYTYILYRSMKALQSYSIFNKSLTQE